MARRKRLEVVTGCVAVRVGHRGQINGEGFPKHVTVSRHERCPAHDHACSADARERLRVEQTILERDFGGETVADVSNRHLEALAGHAINDPTTSPMPCPFVTVSETAYRLAIHVNG